MKSILIILTAVILSSCLVSQKRFNRILKNNPHLAENKDSTIIDTSIITIPEVSHDTVTHIYDTLILTKENLFVKTYIHKDSIFVEAKCKEVTDTIIKRIEVPITLFEYTDPKTKFERIFNKLIWILVGVAVMYVVWRIIKKFLL